MSSIRICNNNNLHYSLVAWHGWPVWDAGREAVAEPDYPSRTPMRREAPEELLVGLPHPQLDEFFGFLPLPNKFAPLLQTAVMFIYHSILEAFCIVCV